VRRLILAFACLAVSPPARATDAIPWTLVADGIAFKDTGNPRGSSAFVGYVGYRVSAEHARAWVTALYEASLEERGVRYVWAVRGPDHPMYAHREIKNSALAKALVTRVARGTPLVIVAGHSSGSYPAHELLAQLAGGMDPDNVTAGKIVYFDLDGGEKGLTHASVARLRRAYFVGSFDATNGTYSPHAAEMQGLAKTYDGTYLENDASASGCYAGASWCIHATLITSRPHDPRAVDPARDYRDFISRPVVHSYIDRAASVNAPAPVPATPANPSSDLSAR
jgi:hypothetical protein